MFNRHDITRNAFQLTGNFASQGYDWWWHSFTGHDAETGVEKSFFIEFFLCNPALGGERPVLGQLPSNKKENKKPSYLMVKAGAWGDDAAQLHKFYGWRKVEVEAGYPFSISAGEFFLTEDATKGCIRISEDDARHYREWMCQAGEMSWSLVMDKQVAFNVGYGAGKLFRKLQAFEMFWHAEGMKTAYKGEVMWNGRRYIVRPEDCYGYADKNWGKDFTSPWVWLSSNNLWSEKHRRKLRNSVFDIGGGRPKIGPLVLNRKLLSAFWYEGQGYEFNFSKFWTFCRTNFRCRETRNTIIWHVDQRTLFNRMVADITCRKDEMLLINYESPDGARRHRRLWNGGTGTGKIKIYRFGKLVDTVKARNVGCEWGEYRSSNASQASSGRISASSRTRKGTQRSK